MVRLIWKGATHSDSKNRLALWRFVIPIAVQIGVMVAVPLPAIITQVTGRVVRLETEPMKLSELVKTSPQGVRYKISNLKTLETLPGWKALPGTPIPCPKKLNYYETIVCNKDAKVLDVGIVVYAIVEKPETDTEKNLPTPWKIVAVSGDRPTDLPENRVAIEGESMGDFVKYEGELFYLMRSQREQLLATIDPKDDKEKSEKLVIELKVDEKGKAVPVGLWVGDRNYRL